MASPLDPHLPELLFHFADCPNLPVHPKTPSFPHEHTLVNTPIENAFLIVMRVAQSTLACLKQLLFKRHVYRYHKHGGGV